MQTIISLILISAAALFLLFKWMPRNSKRRVLDWLFEKSPRFSRFFSITSAPSAKSCISACSSCGACGGSDITKTKEHSGKAIIVIHAQ
jgi:hypothetical protein